jgi:hypothetical protein
MAIESDPKSTKAIVNLAATLASESRFADADAILQKALEIDPANKEAGELKGLLKAHGKQ